MELILNRYRQDVTAATGGFNSQVFASLSVIDAKVKGRDLCGQFLATDGGYCIDAPSLVPAGSHRFDLFADIPHSSYAVR